MADTKVSSLPEPLILNFDEDKLYLAQPNASRSLTLRKLFDNVTNPVLKGNIHLDSNVQYLNSGGVLDLSKPVTHFNISVGNSVVNIPNGEPHQIKIIVSIASSGGNFILNGNTTHYGNIIFHERGDTATLLFTNDRWAMIGGTATLD